MTLPNPRLTEMPVPETTYTVELVPPDIEPYRAGNTGIDYVTTFAAAAPGPHVMVTALTHGNEICGAIVLDTLFRAGIRPRQGKLTLAFNNVAAYQEFDPRMPIASRYVDEDFNRLWSPATLDGPRKSAELSRARTVRAMVDKADYLLDLHSMQHATAPLMLAGLLDKSRDLALKTGIPELIMCDAGHAAGPRMRDYGAFGDPASAKTALLIECGQHWERRAAEVANDVTLRFLIALGVVARDDVAALGGPDFDAQPRQRVILVTEAVTISGERFDFVEPYRGLEVIPKQGTVIAHEDDREIRTPYDECILIMPSRRLLRGRDRGAPRALRRLNTPKRSFPPIVDARAVALVLGTLPGEESLRRQQYYAHPRNLFWPILFALFGDGAVPDYDARIAFAAASRLALWDVCGLAERRASADAAIRAEIPNAIPALLDAHPGIRIVAFNGSTARRLYDRHFPRRPGIAYLALPSTSPAHARLDFAAKLAEWQVLRAAVEG